MTEIDYDINGKFLTDWKNEQRQTLMTMYPQLTEDKIEKVLNKMIKKSIVVPKATIHNNYEHKELETDLLTVVDWLDKVKPILGGGGTFFKPKEINPAADLLEVFLVMRKKYKGKLKEHDPRSNKYKDLDRSQLTEKINANSYYGANGCVSSNFFNLYTATAVTATGRSLISTTYSAFEQFVSNNQKFYNIDECIHQCNYVVSKEEKMSSNFLKSISVDNLIEYFKGLFFDYKESYTDILRNYFNNLPDSKLKRIYYVNNIYAFSEHEEILRLLDRIMEGAPDFKNPNKPPVEIVQDLEMLWCYYKEFVLFDNFVFNRIERLKHDKRRAVTTVDTDSNMVCLNTFVDFVNRKVVNQNDIVRERDKNEIKFAIVNTCCYCLTQMMKVMMYRYTTETNVPEERKARINMKNEFYFRLQVLADVKKRYITSVVLREGEFIDPPKIDIKGFDFIKSTTMADIKEKYIGMLKQHVLFSDTLEISEMLREIKLLDKEIRDSLANGEKRFMTPISVNEVQAYKFPMRMQGYRGVIAWNAAYPDKEIVLPEKLDIIKVNLDTPENMNRLKEINPDIHANIIKNIYENSNEEIRKKGVNMLGVPRNEPCIPDWAVPFIDVDKITNDILAKFFPVFKSLGLNIFGSSKRTYHSNIVNL